MSVKRTRAGFMMEPWQREMERLERKMRSHDDIADRPERRRDERMCWLEAEYQKYKAQAALLQEEIAKKQERIYHLERQRDALQGRNTELVVENRRLKDVIHGPGNLRGLADIKFGDDQVESD